MRFELGGSQIYASTGGRDPVEGRDWLIFLHGAGSSHLVWNLQTRAMAYDGYNVLAPDFPGHNLSDGAPLETIVDQANWLIAVMDHLKIQKAVVIGHSQGGLVGLRLSQIAPERLAGLVFVATAAAIPVNEALISTAQSAEDKAKSSMTSWGLGSGAHHYDNTVPGFSHIGHGLRVMDLNQPGALERDLVACNSFEEGLAAASNVACKSMCVFAGQDRMTPLKFGRKLAEALPDNTMHVIEKSGHTLPTEYPQEFNSYLRAFLASLK